MAKRKLYAELEAEAETERQSLVGRTIVAVEYIRLGEGEYVLTLDDGRRVSFSACGDDMTYVTFGISKC